MRSKPLPGSFETKTKVLGTYLIVPISCPPNPLES